MPPVNTNKPPSTSNGSTNRTIPVAPLATNPHTTTALKSSPLVSSKANGPPVKPIQQIAAAAIASGEREARERALRELTSQDEKRMRFLALLCGQNSFPNKQNRDRSNSLGRERSSSLGGKEILEDQDDVGAASQQALSDTTANYAPTTPQNLSRRILHKQGCGYYDDACSLLLSAAADRFMATVLTQAKACRDRRLEGQKSMLVERRERKRHRRRVLKERVEREKRFREEIDRKRKDVEEGKKPETTSGALTSDGLSLNDADVERLNEFRKNNADLDAEEDYYHSYFDNGNDELKDGEMDESDDDDSDEEIDDKQYDLLLRDVVRPLGAWGFDLSSKVAFDSSSAGLDEENEYVLDDDKVDDDEDQDDDADDEDADEEGGDDTDNDDGENGAKKPSSPTKKTSPTKKKTGPKKAATKKRKAEDLGGEKVTPAAKKPAAAKSNTDKTAAADPTKDASKDTSIQSPPAAASKPA